MINNNVLLITSIYRFYNIEFYDIPLKFLI